jgi:hypothetical protein
MFALIQNQQFVRLISPGTAFEIDGNYYPANWLNLSTPQDKLAVGIVDVRYGDRPDDKYYWVSEDTPTYSTKFQEVYVGYTATPKDLFTLQNNAVTAVQQQAWSILQPTDWMVVKAFETNTKIADNWNTWRAEIRTQCNAQVAAITACTTVDQLAALAPVTWAHDPNYVAPTQEVTPA